MLDLAFSAKNWARAGYLLKGADPVCHLNGSAGLVHNDMNLAPRRTMAGFEPPDDDPAFRLGAATSSCVGAGRPRLPKLVRQAILRIASSQQS
jgi:hypothetical protein